MRPIRVALAELLGRWRRGAPADPRHASGRRGERAAAAWLRKHGYHVLGRNLRSPAGEIDIVCLDPSRRITVLVEVKTSTRTARDAARNLSREQLGRLARALAWARRDRRFAGRPARLDLVLVSLDARGHAAEITHLPAEPRL